MRNILRVTGINLRKSFIKFLKNIARARHGIQADVCAIWATDEGIYWETSYTNGIANKDSPSEFMIRKLVGQNMLSLAGVPREEKDIPIVYLVVFPSLFKFVGFSKSKKILKEWPGKSMAFNREVVKYKRFI
jgi:hypothetical protein